LGVNPELESDDNLKPEELKTLLQTSGMPEKQQKMLMGIFDMDFLSVNDVMVPRNEIVGIDLDDPLELILKNLQETDFTYTPFYKDSIDNIVGFLTVNRKADFFSDESIDLEHLLSKLEEPIFIPENTSLNRQLANFQTVDTRVGLIVDEYGDIEGLITLRDILEVIVGEITSGAIEKMDIMPQTDGSFMIEGNVMIREINSRINWNLPTEGPKTLSGLILETVQSIPETNVGISIGGYRFETILIKDNVVKIAKAEKIEIDLEDEELDEE
jgi:Mg2+/Co2+ transporter CorB